MHRIWPDRLCCPLFRDENRTHDIEYTMVAQQEKDNILQIPHRLTTTKVIEKNRNCFLFLKNKKAANARGTGTQHR